MERQPNAEFSPWRGVDIKWRGVNSIALQLFVMCNCACEDLKMDDEYYLDDEITDLVAVMVKQDASGAIALLCGLLIGVTESVAENQGHDPKAKMELVGATRVVTISAVTT